jgi:hypothetical protein
MVALFDRSPPFAPTLTRRTLLEAGALVVGFALAPAAAAQAQRAAAVPRDLPLDQVDSFLAIRGDGTVVVHSGKVDLGTGHRIAMRQMVGEELAIGVDRIDLIEGDTALTPNQGPTAGSSGIMRGGVELRQAAATAREALLTLAAERLQLPVAELTLADGEVRAASGRRIAVAALLGERGFDVKMNPKAALKDPSQCSSASRCRGPTLPRRSPVATSTSTTISCPACCTAACCGRRRSARRSRRSTSRRSPPCPAFGSCGSPISSLSSPPTNGPRCAPRASSGSAGARARR